LKVDILRTVLSSLKNEDIDQDLRKVKEAVVQTSLGHASIFHSAFNQSALEPTTDSSEWLAWVLQGSTVETMHALVIKCVDTLSSSVDITTLDSSTAQDSLIFMLGAVDKIFRSLRLHPGATKVGGKEISPRLQSFVTVQMKAGKDLTAATSYQQVARTVFQSYQTQLGWDDNQVITVMNEFMNKLRAMDGKEAGGKYANFIEAVKNPLEDETALFEHWSEGLISQVLGKQMTLVMKPYFDTVQSQRQARIRKSLGTPRVNHIAQGIEDMQLLDTDDFNDDDDDATALGSALNNLQSSFVVLNLSRDMDTTVEFLVNNIINNVICEQLEWDKYVNMLEDQRARAYKGSAPLSCFHCGKEHTLRDCNSFKEELLRAAKPLTEMMNNFRMRHGEQGLGALAYQIRSLAGLEPLKSQAKSTNRGWNNKRNSHRAGNGMRDSLNSRQP
jgi:hypothetical protein